MTLATLIRKGGLQQIATAISATTATHDNKGDDSVAKIAAVAVASAPCQRGAILLHTQWDTTDWWAFYNERAGVAEYDGGLSRSDAERMAYESCITHWMNKNPPAHSGLATCPECHKALDRNPLAVLTGNSGHIWLHDRCHVPWLARRRQEAIAALAGMGIIRKE